LVGASSTEGKVSRIGNFHGTNDAEENSNMKRFALVLLSLAFAAQAFAIIRPPYPAKPMPPYNSGFILIGDDAKAQTVKAPK
jgi:hypothetical protein